MKSKLEVSIEAIANRRLRLLEKIPKASIAILPSGNLLHRNADTEYPFRQESNFYYLTGFNEPESLLVLIKDHKGMTETILFCRKRDPEKEKWVGKRAGQEGAIKQFGANRSFAIDELEEAMPILLENKQQIFYSLGQSKDWDTKLMKWVNTVRKKVRAGIEAPNSWFDLSLLVEEMRLIKGKEEIECMRKAAEVSAEAHAELMRHCQPKQMECQLAGLFIYECAKKGLQSMAYPPIVGGGKNGCILHYIENNAPLNAHELVLVDAGAECENYAADITRTFPVNGKFSADQKAIYNLVLQAQLAAIEAVRPGVFWNRLQEIILETLVQGLVSLGILTGDVKTLIMNKAYQPFYMHSSGHWLGLDVHDAGEYKIKGEWRPLLPGMVITVEPGLYIDQSDSVDKRWWGIGIRIEDDILVTETGFEVLSKKAPKTVEEIEKIMMRS
jgi:Xaa-Pro aminopeptidase